MDSKTFYLKYRPKKFSQLDLPEIGAGLLQIIKSKKIPHALLFPGPKGTGKTSAARIFAKAVNCLHPAPSGEPCGKCNACRQINDGTAMDLIEIDAASNRGIDDIRDLKEKIRLSPVNFRYKVYIIDEVHMLTAEAFNALLKTLEEPPSHAIFILCTTQPEKLPETIISRCLRFNFRKAKVEEIIKGPLKRAVKGERLKVEDGVLEEIGRAVDGSFRDAHKLLEQLSFDGKKITLKKTRELLGQVEEFSPDKLLKLLTKKDIQKSLKEIDRVVNAGADLSVYGLRVLDRLRQGLLAKVGFSEINAPQELEALEIGEIKFLVSLFSRAISELKYSPIAQLPLEIAVIEYCLSDKKGVASPPKNDKKIDCNGEKVKVKLQEIMGKWQEILSKIKPLNHSIEALLKASRPLKVEGDFLTLEVFYKFHKDRLEAEKCRTIIEEVVGQTFGSPLKLKCVLGEKPASSQLNKQSNPLPNQPQSEPTNVLDVANAIFNGKIVN